MDGCAMSGDDQPWKPESTEIVGPPRLLAGKYQLGKLIGEGGMGAVYAAEHTGLGAQVAIKLLGETFLTEPDSLARFRREARAMGAVKHDNVVTVMDTGTDEDGVPFIVMELLEGETLGGMLRRERNISPSRACGIISQILAGLTAAHKQGIIHRDLKPGNVFMADQIDGTLRAKILDFGISKLLGSGAVLNVTAAGVAVGTPSYMAPEQIRGEPDLDARVDVYAVGITLYRMLTGKLPFRAKTSDQLSAKILVGEMVPPRELRPQLAPKLEAVVLKAMHWDRDERFADAESFAIALRTATGSLWADKISGLGGLAGSLRAEGTAEKVAAGTGKSGQQTKTENSDNTEDDNTEDDNTEDDETEDDAPNKTIAASPAAKRATALSVAKPLATSGPWFRRRWFGAIALLAIAAGASVIAYRSFSASGPTAPSGPALRIGVTRFLPTEQVKARFDGLVAYLTTALDRPTELVIAADARELTAMLDASEIDLAALSPYPYVLAQKKLGNLSVLATPVTVGGRKGYFGSILVATESNIRSVADFKGKPFCFVKTGSTSGYLMPRRELREAGIDPNSDLGTIHYGQNHLGTLKLLASNSCVGASVFTNIWHDAAKHRLDPDSFRSVADYFMPHDAYVVSAKVTTEEREAIATALLALVPNGDLAKRVLTGDNETAGFAKADDSDFDAIRTAVDLEAAANQ